MDASDPELARQYPALHEWLTIRELDGKPIESATLLLFTEDGAFKACLSDRETNRVCFRSGVSFLAVLRSLEEVLASGSVEWRERRDPSARKRG